MNIFAVSESPRECAEALDDVRLRKMYVETAQLLCGALRLRGVNDGRLYKVSHPNHPCAIWARENSANWRWLFSYWLCLGAELKRRFPDKMHKTKFLLPTLYEYSAEISVLNRHLPHSIIQTAFPNCARNKSLGLDFTNISDVHYAYMVYLNHRWQQDTLKGRTPKWTLRGYPIFAEPIAMSCGFDREEGILTA